MIAISTSLRGPALVLAAALSSALPALAADPGYTETWNNEGDLAGWTANTTSSTVVNPGSGGNSGGYLLTRRSGAFPVGASTDLAAATGSFGSQVWTASVDLLGVAGTSSDVWLRFRYQDSTFNGWRHRLTGELDSTWQTFGVTFDSSWSDLQAQANGWESDFPDGFASVGWAQTMGNVYTTEIRIDGTTTLAAGIDNFSVTTPVPEPSTCALMAGGLGLIGWIGRRRQRQ